MTVFTDATRADAEAIIARYPEGRGRSALLPMLHLVQSEEGYVSQHGIAFCAEMLGLTKAEVGAVATFYTMYKRRPVGDHIVSVCTNALCGMVGGDEIYAALKGELGVGHNETAPAPDPGGASLTLEHAECLAACDYAPVVTVDYEYYDKQDVASALELVRELRAGRKPHPTRGARLCSFRETERLLAGFPDPREGVVDEGLPGEPTLVGLQYAQGGSAPAVGGNA
ncbi:MAG TPA: NADH-quinone oxidoreductase subunit NuoE [Mycobacteriales bacterium]|jgi:NADH-quinone oxidoreductase subunit E|nr:NADH-quinone oxidoreductase subunit NuoE [Mycobacteriales bacterium]